MTKRVTRSRRLRVYFTYPYAHPELRSDLEKIRRALRQKYTILEVPPHHKLKRPPKSEDLKTIYDSVEAEIKRADLVLAYLPKEATSLGVISELMMALALDKRVAVVGPRAVRKNLSSFLSEAINRSFDSPEDLKKQVNSLEE